MALLYFYNSNAKGDGFEVVDKNWVAIYGGIDPSMSTPEQLAEKGFYKYTAAVTPFFNSNIFTLRSEVSIEGTNAIQTYTVEPLPLPESKTSYLKEVDSRAYAILLPTDWMVVRQAETGATVPENVLLWRQATREGAQVKKEAIESCETAEELESYVNSEEYNQWPTLA